nr:unnamed protein product [Callosobruchus analis]
MPKRRRDKRSPSSSTTTSDGSSTSTSSSSGERRRRRRRCQRRSRGSSRRSTVRLSNRQLIEVGVSTALNSLRERTAGNELAKVIPDYDPRRDSIVDWINVIDEHARCYNWDDSTTKFQALNKLKYNAEKWYNNFVKNEVGWANYSWQQWKTLLTDVFCAKRNTYKIFMDIAHHKSREGESLYSFYFDHLALIDKLKANFNDSDKISLIVGAINVPTVTSSVMAANISSLNILADYLRDIHFEVPSTSRVQNTQVRAPQEDKKYSKPNVTCFCCGKKGHKRSDCYFKTKVCKICNTVGHLQNVCNKNQKQIKPENKSTEKSGFQRVKLISAEANKFSRDILVNNRKVPAFIDFGSDCSILQYDTAVKLDLQIKPMKNAVTLSGFLGHGIEVDRVAIANVNINDVNCRVRFT